MSNSSRSSAREVLVARAARLVAFATVVVAVSSLFLFSRQSITCAETWLRVYVTPVTKSGGGRSRGTCPSYARAPCSSLDRTTRELKESIFSLLVMKRGNECDWENYEDYRPVVSPTPGLWMDGSVVEWMDCWID